MRNVEAGHGASRGSNSFAIERPKTWDSTTKDPVNNDHNHNGPMVYFFIFFIIGSDRNSFHAPWLIFLRSLYHTASHRMFLQPRDEEPPVNFRTKHSAITTGPSLMVNGHMVLTHTKGLMLERCVIHV